MMINTTRFLFMKAIDDDDDESVRYDILAEVK